MSSDSGVTWQSAGVLQYCSVVYKLMEVNVEGTPYLYAATGNNGRVYRASLAATGISQSGSDGSALRLSIAPMPFRDRTSISYSLPVAGQVSLRLYDISGKLLATVQDGHAEAGVHNLTVSGLALTARGICVLRLETQSGSATQKLVIE